MSTITRVTYRDSAYDLAANISNEYNLELVDDPDKYTDVLIVSDQKISLKIDGFPKEFFIDFFADNLEYRTLSITKEAILKACGVKKGKTPSILDLTGGWGRDGYLLARAGCEVLLLERDPIVYLLLTDGIKRLKEKTNYNLQVINIDASQYLGEETIEHEVIYLDPIRPQENKRVKNKKEMEILRRIIKSEQEYHELLNLALQKSQGRVVIKSGRHAHIECNKSPTFSIIGKNTKFDIYSKL